MLQRRTRMVWAGLVLAGLAATGAMSLGLAAQAERQPGQPGQPPAGGRPPGPPRADRPFENVEGAMRTINGGLRRLKASAADPAQRDQALQALGRMQSAAVFAKGSTPGDHAPTPAKLEEYRRGQIKLLTLMLECETAILDGDVAATTAVVAKMEALRDASHKAFNVGDDEEGGNPAGGGGGGGGG